MKLDRKDNFKNKILERYFEIEEVEDEENKTVDLKEKEDLDVDISTSVVVDEMVAPKKPTIISADTVIHGNVNASNDLEVSGQVIGDIVVEGMVKVFNGTITGNIKATKVYIKGSVVDGNIECESMIDIIDNSEINGNIMGGDIVINSKCKGNIVAGQCLKLLESANVRGDIQTKTIKIDEGAIVEGQLKMIAIG